ncbi:MAG TPA: aminoglycoside 6'-N-acetyltransferase [Thermoanaerobaculia bacterium]|nr:aminoglycoside 6'-N-acetyltransferase [Thermoanaerobaculia bacterium]
MRVRSVETRDRDEWLRQRCALWPGSKRDHAEEIDRFFAGDLPELHEVLLVEGEDERILGFVELSIRPYAEGCATDRVGYLEGWYVEPHARRRGVGRLLVEAAWDWARRQGCTEFASDTEVENEMSASAHRACGFEEAGVVRCFRKVL